LVLDLTFFACEAEAGTIYSTDFSADPDWTTNNTAHYYWDSDAGAYYHREVNGSEEYTYKLLSGLSDNTRWRLEYDLMPLTTQWAAGSRLALSDADMEVLKPTYFCLDFATVDAGNRVYLEWATTLETRAFVFPTGFSPDVWYHCALEWSPDTHTLSAVVKERDKGNLLGSATVDVKGTFAGVDRLAESTINHTYGRGRTASGYYDNVTVSANAIPEPLSVAVWSVLGVSALAGARWRRKRAG
jgi:hypothetical protein